MPKQHRVMSWLARIGLAGLVGNLALGSAMALAEVAHQRNYVRPEIHRGSAMEIREGRHPVVERTSAAGSFVA